MFGFIHESIRQLTIRTYGEEFWRECMKRAGFECGKENVINHHYADEDTYAIVDSICVMAKIPREEVWEMYGTYFVEYTMTNGWEVMLRSMSSGLKGFLNNLDSLHYFIDHVVYKANLRGPSFRCEETGEDTITLHYFSSRSGLYPIVKGVIREIARRIFNMEISIAIAGRTQRSVQMASGERVEEHVTFLIKFQHVSAPNSGTGDISFVVPQSPCKNWVLRVTQTDFASMLPFHFVMDRDCRLVSYGSALPYHVAIDLLEPGTPVIRIFDIYRPQIPFDYENIMNFINGVFVLQVRTSPIQALQKHQRSSGHSEVDFDYEAGMHTQHLKLKGQMMQLNKNDELIYICSPYVTTVPDLLQYGLRLSAIPLYDATRDLILLNQQRLNDVEDNLQLEANNDQLETMARDLEEEKRKADALLREVLPASVAAQLMNGASVDAREYADATVMFSDVPAFQSIVPQSKPTDVVVMLNDLFTKFDHLITTYNVYKVETIGDSYMTVAGVPEFIEDHCERICHVALGMIWEARTVSDPIQHQPLRVRCGIHTGNIVTGVVGQKMPRYCLFGDTVNTSARMESHSPPGRIHCTADAMSAAQRTGRFEFLARGAVHIKGKGLMETFYLTKSCKRSIWEITGHRRDENLHSIDGYAELFDGIVDEPNTDSNVVLSKTCTIC